MARTISKLCLALYIALSSLINHAACASEPTVKTVNGTYKGLYLPEWQQEAFLGMPYALPPVGELRFARPHYINTSFEGIRNATSYGPAVRALIPSDLQF
jgi:hypothetical protein